jgi:hypothetical protein
MADLAALQLCNTNRNSARRWFTVVTYQSHLPFQCTLQSGRRSGGQQLHGIIEGVIPEKHLQGSPNLFRLTQTSALKYFIERNSGLTRPGNTLGSNRKGDRRADGRGSGRFKGSHAPLKLFELTLSNLSRHHFIRQSLPDSVP